MSRCVDVSEVSEEDQQKIDMFMQNQQQQRGRRRMPHAAPRPLAQVRQRPPRLMGLGIMRPPFMHAQPLPMQRRPLFRPRIAGRAPMGFGHSSVMPLCGLPPRQKILVNPHFRGSLSPTVVHGSTPSTSPASVYPKLMNFGVAPRRQQQPQLTVNIAFVRIIFWLGNYAKFHFARTGNEVVILCASTK